MDTLLMLRGETRHCDDCATATVFVPVDGAASELDDVWICTVCDGAVLLPALLDRVA
ncbi:MAG: hypothetical protein ACJ72D_18320 [Marmoricola sp.]